MASPKNGQITFYFDTLPELQRQLWEALGPMRLMDDTPEPARGVLGILGEGMTAASLVGKSPMAGKTAIMDDVRKANAEAAAALVAEQQAAQLATVTATAKEGVKADTAPTPPAEVTQPTPEPEKPVEATPTAPAPCPVMETLTVDDIPKAEYKDLLAFCERNPGVGVDVSKCQQAFFRKLVEMKVKAFLETK